MMWTPPMKLKALICLIDPMISIKQTLRTIITFESAGVEVSFTHGWQLRENFSTNLGIILLILNCLIFNLISLLLEVMFSIVENQKKNITFNCKSKDNRMHKKIKRQRKKQNTMICIYKFLNSTNLFEEKKVSIVLA